MELSPVEAVCCPPSWLWHLPSGLSTWGRGVAWQDRIPLPHAAERGTGAGLPARFQQHPTFSAVSRRRLQRGVSTRLNCLLPPPLLGQMPKIAVELCLNYSPK